MTYYDHPENVEQYVKISQGYDGLQLINALKQHLAAGSSVLELGMGEGKDLDLLAQSYRATGSDASRVFMARYQKQHADADLLLLDAVTLDTKRQFQALYSNKVLHHLSPAQLATSFERQAQCLIEPGYVLHSFWLGDGAEEFAGDVLHYYQPEHITELISPHFELVKSTRYAESDDNDSFYIIGQKRSR